jgi:hypothetical protein
MLLGHLAVAVAPAGEGLEARLGLGGPALPRADLGLQPRLRRGDEAADLGLRPGVAALARRDLAPQAGRGLLGLGEPALARGEHERHVHEVGRAAVAADEVAH